MCKRMGGGKLVIPRMPIFVCRNIYFLFVYLFIFIASRYHKFCREKYTISYESGSAGGQLGWCIDCLDYADTSQNRQKSKTCGMRGA